MRKLKYKKLYITIITTLALTCTILTTYSNAAENTTNDIVDVSANHSIGLLPSISNEKHLHNDVSTDIWVPTYKCNTSNKASYINAFASLSYSKNIIQVGVRFGCDINKKVDIKGYYTYCASSLHDCRHNEFKDITFQQGDSINLSLSTDTDNNTINTLITNKSKSNSVKYLIKNSKSIKPLIPRVSFSKYGILPLTTLNNGQKVQFINTEFYTRDATDESLGTYKYDNTGDITDKGNYLSCGSQLNPFVCGVVNNTISLNTPSGTTGTVSDDPICATANYITRWQYKCHNNNYTNTPTNTPTNTLTTTTTTTTTTPITTSNATDNLYKIGFYDFSSYTLAACVKFYAGDYEFSSHCTMLYSVGGKDSRQSTEIIPTGTTKLLILVYSFRPQQNQIYRLDLINNSNRCLTMTGAIYSEHVKYETDCNP